MNPDVSPPEHGVGQVNLTAWDKAAMAKRVNQARLRAKAAGTPEAAAVAEEMEINYREQVQQQYDREALAEDMNVRLAERPMYSEDEFLSRLNELQDLKPGSKEFTERYIRGSAAPDPVMYIHSPGPAEGQMQQRRAWAVDASSIGLDFDKHAGDEMTDEEYAAICQLQNPVNWDKDGNPTDFRPLHDSREFSRTDTFELKEATKAEREAAKQYHVTGYVPEGVGGTDVPQTEHTIKPDPSISEDWDEYA